MPNGQGEKFQEIFSIKPSSAIQNPQMKKDPPKTNPRGSSICRRNFSRFHHINAPAPIDCGLIARRGNPQADGIKNANIGIQSTLFVRAKSKKGGEVKTSNKVCQPPSKRLTNARITVIFRMRFIAFPQLNGSQA